MLSLAAHSFEYLGWSITSRFSRHTVRGERGLNPFRRISSRPFPSSFQPSYGDEPHVPNSACPPLLFALPIGNVERYPKCCSVGCFLERAEVYEGASADPISVGRSSYLFVESFAEVGIEGVLKRSRSYSKRAQLSNRCTGIVLSE